MNMLQLRYFTAVARLENMSRAAEFLHVSQPALSKNIAKLEDEIGAPLFTRAGKKVVLNTEGARFLECANLVLEKVDSALEEIRFFSTGSGTKLKIGTSGVCEKLMKSISDFQKDHPEAQFDIRTEFEAISHPDINDFDVIVYPDSIRFEKFSGYPFYEERYYLAVPEGHALAYSRTVTAKALEGAAVVFLRQGDNTAEYPCGVCSALGIHFASQCFTDSREVQRQMIASGAAVGFVPEGECEPYRSKDGVQLIPFMDSRFNRKMMISFRRDKHLTELGLAFKRFVGESLALPFAEE